jgi:hypothetical protein
MDSEQHPGLPWPYLDKYFEIFEGNEEEQLPEDDKKNIRIQCKLCKPIIKILKTSVSSTGNLRKHIKVCISIALLYCILNL